MQYYSEIGKQYRRAIIISRFHPCHGAGREAVARKFGLSVNDFIWITGHDNWRRYVEGISRSTLVLDPFNLTHEWCEHGQAEFAGGIIGAFDTIAMAPKCERVLARWLIDRNPPAYARMVASGVLPEPDARDGPSLEQEPQQPLQPHWDGDTSGVPHQLPRAAAQDRSRDSAGRFQA